MKHEGKLVFGLRNGDKNALSAIYDFFYQDLYFYLIKFSSQDDLVQNAIHDMFLELWNSRSALGEIRSLKAYLLISSRRKLIKLIRYEQRGRSIDLTYGNGAKELEFQYSHEDFLIGEEVDTGRQNKILTAINQLPSRQKEAVYLRYYEKLSIEEIALVQEIGYQSVLNNLQRAYQQMRTNPLILELLKAVSLLMIFGV